MALRANVIANYAGQGWTAAANVLFVPVFIHYLGIQSYALVGIYTILQAWLALLDMGMSPTLSREMARFVGGTMAAREAVELLRSVELVCAAFVAACAFVLAAGAPWIASHWLTTSLPHDEVILALRLCGLVTALRFMETIYRSALYGLDHQIWFNGVNVAITTARFGGSALVLAFISPTIMTFFLWQVAVSLVSVVLLRRKSHTTLPRTMARRFSGEALRSIGGFAGGLVAINLTALVLTQADKLIISHVLPLAMLGYYTLAYTVSNLIAAAVGPVSQAFYPVLARQFAGNHAQAMARSFSTGAQVAAVATTVIGSILLLFPIELVLCWSNDAALAANTHRMIFLLGGGAMANALLQIPYFTMLARGEVRAPLYLNIAAAGGFLAALLWAIPRHGLEGAALSWLGVNLAMLIAMPYLVRRALPVPLFHWVLRDTAAPLICGLTAAALFRWALPADLTRLETLLALGVTATATLAAAGLGASGLRHAFVSQLRDRLRGAQT
jgi:O-antigen/teichoic acid export membrane protein